MKKHIFYISVLCVLFCSACYKEEIITSKPGEPIGAVTNLEHAVSDSNINLTWKLPATLPADIIKPVSVFIQISVDGQNRGSVVLENAPETYTYTPYEAAKKYKFTVKVMGKVDTKNPAVSNLRYSPGQTVSF
ncbi:MAG: DUF4945 domain-containing protein [Segetibacter sp.]